MTAAPMWGYWKRHLIVCADCTAGDMCQEGRGILGRASPDDAPWLTCDHAGTLELPEDHGPPYCTRCGVKIQPRP